MHDGHKEVGHLGKLLAKVGKLVKQSGESLKVFEVLVGLRASSLNLLLELAERSSVGGLVLLEELENFLDALRVKLVANCIQVLGFVLPEIDLS